jgi:hypothetical protein
LDKREKLAAYLRVMLLVGMQLPAGRKPLVTVLDRALDRFLVCTREESISAEEESQSAIHTV